MIQSGPLNARRIIMGLLQAERGEPLSSRQVVAACGLFGVAENSARVALARLSAAGLVASAERGSYRLGEAASALAGDVATWRQAEARLSDWSGHYLAVLTSMLGRTDRTALRRRERALEMLGFRELERGFHVRPDNLVGGVQAVRQRLYALGLERQAPVLRASEFDATRQAQLPTLWDGEGLNQRYRQQYRQLNDWLARADQLAPEDAAREAFLLGGRAIRYIVFDPLLPAPFVDVSARHDFIRMTRQFDQAGYAIWQRLYQSWVLPAGTERHSAVLQ